MSLFHRIQRLTTGLTHPSINLILKKYTHKWKLNQEGKKRRQEYDSDSDISEALEKALDGEISYLPV
jgi:hypothetical protein